MTPKGPTRYSNGLLYEKLFYFMLQVLSSYIKQAYFIHKLNKLDDFKPFYDRKHSAHGPQCIIWFINKLYLLNFQ